MLDSSSRLWKPALRNCQTWSWALQQRLREQSPGQNAGASQPSQASANGSAGPDLCLATGLANQGQSMVGPDRDAQDPTGAPAVGIGEDAVRSVSVLSIPQAARRTRESSGSNPAVNRSS